MWQLTASIAHEVNQPIAAAVTEGASRLALAGRLRCGLQGETSPVAPTANVPAVIARFSSKDLPRSNRQMFATLHANIFCVTIAPYENPN
jgi:hypothetical protein